MKQAHSPRCATALACAAILMGGISAAAGQDRPQRPPPLIVRHTHYFVVVNPGDTAPTVSVRSKPFFRYTNGLGLEVIDNQGTSRLEKALPVGAHVNVAVPGPVAPYYLVVAKPGMNGVTFAADRPWGIVAGDRGVGSNGPVPRMHLYVPAECEAFSVTCHAPSPREGGRLTVLDPDGTEALTMDGELDAAETRDVPVPSEHRGKVWSLTWDKPRTAKANLDDIEVTVDGRLAPLLWPKRAWAVTHGPDLWRRHREALDSQPK